MPGWGLCGGPFLREQQWVPWTPLLASPRACDLLAERKVHRSAGHTWLWQLWASYVTQAGHKHRCTVPLCPCQPGQDPWAGPSPSGTELSYNRAVISLCVLWAVPAQQPGRGNVPNARVYFYFQPPASIYPQGRPMNHRARWVGLAAACPLNPAPSLGPSPHTHRCLPRRPGSRRAPMLQEGSPVLGAGAAILGRGGCASSSQLVCAWNSLFFCCPFIPELQGD